MSIDQAHAEVNHAWASSYSADAIAQPVESIADEPLGYRVNILIPRLCFRGIYFPQTGKRAWIKVIAQNRRVILKLLSQGLNTWRKARKIRDGEAAAAPGHEVIA